MASTIHRINDYPLDNSIGYNFIGVYRMDSQLYYPFDS